MWEALGWFQRGLHVFYQLLMLHCTSARDITSIHYFSCQNFGATRLRYQEPCV